MLHFLFILSLFRLTISQQLACPAFTKGSTSGKNDISGCGLTGCEWRYSNGQTIEQCRNECESHNSCKAFTFAPLNGDRNHMNRIVCTLYDSDWASQNWTPNQIFCIPTGRPAPNQNNGPGRQYRMIRSHSRYNWDQAKAACGQDGLATIVTLKDGENALAARGNYKNENFWMGLNDRHHEGKFSFVGQPDSICKDEVGKECKDLDLWGPGEPNEWANEDCGHIRSGVNDKKEMLNDIDCGNKFNALCNAPGQRGYTAYAPANGKPGWTWEEAKKVCESKGTTLATVITKQDAERALAERNGVQFENGNAFNGNGKNAYYWIGLNDRNSEGVWRFVEDGSKWDCNGNCDKLSMWAPGEPNDWGSGEDCAGFYNGDRQADSSLNDFPCNWKEWSGRRFFAMCNANVGAAAQAVVENESKYQPWKEVEEVNDEVLLRLGSKDLLVLGLVLANLVVLCLLGRVCNGKGKNENMKYDYDQQV